MKPILFAAILLAAPLLSPVAAFAGEGNGSFGELHLPGVTHSLPTTTTSRPAQPVDKQPAYSHLVPNQASMAEVQTFNSLPRGWN